MIEILRNYNLKVNFSKGIFTSDEKIILIENDNKSVKFNFNFEEDINGQTILLKTKHYLGKVIEKTILVESNKAEFIFTNDILTAGNLKMSISLIGTDNEILTSAEYLDNIVIKETLGEGTAPSENEISSLSSVISEVNNLKSAIAAAKENGELNGYSTYEIAVKNGFKGTESEWLKTLIGSEGKGIKEIKFTSTEGLLDTYAVTYTDETTMNFTIKNGNGIVDIEEVSRENNEVTYRINLLDGSHFAFKITEGSNYDDADIKKDILELQKDVADLQSNSETSLKNIVVKEEVIKSTSNSLKLEDTANCLRAKIVSIESNKLEQENRQGYNLLNFDFSKNVINGLTFTPNRKQFT